MIAQTIPNDALEAFRKHLIRESFNFDWPSVETLGQVLSAWESQRTNFIKPKDDKSLNEAYELGFEEGRNS